MGSRKFEEVGGGGGTLLIPGLGEEPSFSLLLRFSRPGDPILATGLFSNGCYKSAILLYSRTSPSVASGTAAEAAQGAGEKCRL